jgi:hypothetical protein
LSQKIGIALFSFLITVAAERSGKRLHSVRHRRLKKAKIHAVELRETLEDMDDSDKKDILDILQHHFPNDVVEDVVEDDEDLVDL